MKKLGDALPSIPKPKKKALTAEKPLPIVTKRHLQLINLAGELAEETREEADTLGFMSRLLIMVNLPYRDPGDDKKTWWRKNGHVSIDINSGTKEGQSLGLPYGAYPRLILAYLVTQAVKTKSPVIYLGKSFNNFLSMINIKNGGTTQKRLKQQLVRTLSASFSWTYETDKQWSRLNVNVASGAQLWWEIENLDENGDEWQNFVRLNHDFYHEITNNAVPLDLRILSVLKNSPLGLDLYLFISWRIYKINKPIFISWESLQQQVGAQYCDLKVFARDCRTHIKRIQALRPDLNINFIKGRLCLKPSFQQN